MGLLSRIKAAGLTLLRDAPDRVSWAVSAGGGGWWAGMSASGQPITARSAVIFGAACRDCPLRERCTTSKDGRTLHLHEHDALLRAARAAWSAGTGLREDYMKHRPNVERAVAQAATWRGRRLKLRYRGVARNNAWLKRRTAAVNLRTLITAGLTRQHGSWTLAPA